LFGENITVAGLVTGQDIIKQLRGRSLGSELLIPENMLRSQGDMFLDDTTPATMSGRLSE
jgi:NifB/MoaA-like Fe-S oxidoreductase